MSASLEVTFAGLPFRNPLLLAPGPATNTADLIVSGVEAGAGGFVGKTVVCDSLSLLRRWPRPRFSLPEWDREADRPEVFSLYSNEPGYRGTLDDYVAMLKAVKSRLDVPVIGSCLASEPSEWGEMCRRLEGDGGCDAIELDISCPHSPKNVSEKVLAGSILDVVAGAVTVPFFVKLRPYDDLLDYVKIAEGGGAKGLVLCNRMAGIDIDIAEKRPVMFGSFGGFGGSWAKYYVFKKIAEVAPRTRLPISATSGIADWEDIVKYVLLGATTVQICTAVILFGFEILRPMVEDVKAYLDRAGLPSLGSLRGAALPHVLPVERIERDPPVTAHLDGDACTNCLRCVPVCFFGAMAEGEETVRIDGTKCDGCGLCTEVCPEEAITMVRAKS
ncbi:MAG: 4Fe-4S binding protein [Planctomycetota bacterium]